MYFYSPSEKGFYKKSIHPTMPDDVIEVSAERHRELIDEQSKGKVIFVNDKGDVDLKDPEPYVPTNRDLKIKAFIEKGWTDPYKLIDDILLRGSDTVMKERQQIKERFK